MTKQERAGIIRRLMAAGLSREDSNLIIDLSLHALSQAQNAMMRVCDSAPLHLRSHIAANAMIGMADSMVAGLALMQSSGVEFRDMTQ